MLEAAARVLAAEFGLFFGIEVPMRSRQTCIAEAHVISHVRIGNPGRSCVQNFGPAPRRSARIDRQRKQKKPVAADAGSACHT
jgi:hypothetical protein